MPHSTCMDRMELAWAAGFWDGEGSAWLTRAEGRETWQPQARINQSSTTGVPEVLIRFERAVDVGRVQGPGIEEGKEPLYRWVVSSRADLLTTYELLRPWLCVVKRAQFEDVLRLPARPYDPPPPSREEERAWAAGLWDGEGCVSIMAHRSHPGRFVLEASITQSSDAGVPEVLKRFRSFVGGAGKIYGPYEAGIGRQPIYRWKLYPTEQIRQVMAELAPRIGTVKREQSEERLAIVIAQPPLLRGNPAWGSHKTHCIRGHDYATARVRPFQSRGRNTQEPRASRQCLACVREDARAKRTA